jgi:hypothetical protein
MNSLFCAANNYYKILERIGIQGILKSRWTWFLILTILIFLWRWQVFIADDLPPASSTLINLKFLVLIPIEFLALFCIFKLSKLKTDFVLSHVNSKYAEKFTKLDQARRFLLKQYFGRDESEYLGLIDEISKAISLQEQFRLPLPVTLPQALLFLYNPDSKQRIYALLLVIVSGLLALSIHDGATISQIFDFFGHDSISLILVVWLILTFFLGSLLMILLAVRIGIELSWAYLIVWVDKDAARHHYTLRYLQRDLLRFHRFIHFTGDK